MRAKIFLFFICLLSAASVALGQTTQITGKVTDALTNEPIPFAAVVFKGSTIAVSTDIDGNYKLSSDSPKDSLFVNYVGYIGVTLPVRKGKTQVINFVLNVNKVELQEVVIRPGENPAHVLLRKIIAHRDSNNKDMLNAYQYENYNKLEFDINNISEKFKQQKLFKPFAFIFDNIDSSSTNEKPFLPVFISESLSDVYYKKDGNHKREIVKASKVSGLENQSVNQFLGDMYQSTNVYDNFINIFGKGFVSPIANIGLLYYRYYLVDSMFIGNQWCYKMTFKPRRKQDLTFIGEIWVHDTTFAVRKINMRICPEANINFVNDIAIVKDYTWVNRQHWMLNKDLLVVDFKATENSIGFVGRKTASYKDFVINQPKPDNFFDSNNEVVLLEGSADHDNAFWQKARHDSLALREKKIYAMVDTVKSLPVYKTYVDVLTLLLTGYKKYGRYEIGPYFNFFSFNPIEGYRFRLGVRISDVFVKNLTVEPYLAYGTLDKRFKYGGTVGYQFSNTPRRELRFYYRNDVEQLGRSSNAFEEGNVLVSLFKRIRTAKLTNIQEERLTYEYEWFNGFSNQLIFAHKDYTALGTLDYSYYTNPEHTLTSNHLLTSEVGLYTRFAYKEKFITGKRKRVSLGSEYPTIQFQYTLGVKGVINSSFNYQKVVLNISDKIKLNPFGYTYYILEAGRIFGNVPYPLLEVHKGNEAYTYDIQAFNLMNYYEFVSDKYLSLFITHHFDGILFDKIPLFRKLKWRELVSAKGLIGGLDTRNQTILVDQHAFNTLTKPYGEAAVGIENIFKVLRIDAIWRLSYLDNPNIAKFGIRANFEITF